MRWLDSITDLMDLSLSKLWELAGDGQGSLGCCGSWGRKELDMTERLNSSSSSSRNSEKHFNVLTRLVVCYKKNVTQKQTSEREAEGICWEEVG